MKLVIKFLNGTSDAKIQTRSQWRILIIYAGTCDVNYKIVFGNYVVFFHFLVLVTVTLRKSAIFSRSKTTYSKCLICTCKRRDAMKLCKVSQVVFFLVCWAAGRPPCYVLRLANKRKLNESRSNLPVFENVEKTSYKRETATASLSISPSPISISITMPRILVVSITLHSIFTIGSYLFNPIWNNFFYYVPFTLNSCWS